MTLYINFGDLLNHPDPVPNDFKLLPICHTSNLEAVRKIIKSNDPGSSCLEPVSSDEAFNNESLLFFFYGRARYMPEEAVKNEYDETNPPIAFVFELESIPCYPKRLLPFDSGGFGRFSIDRPLQEFVITLNTHCDEIKKIIHVLFTENAKYLQKQLTINPSHYPLCTPIGWLSSLYTRKKNSFDIKKFGEQAYTMEIQYNNKIPLSPIAVVLPASLYSTDEAITQMNKAFNISNTSAKIHVYNDEDTLDFNYKTIMKTVDDIVAQYSDQNLKT